jgi:hypothetical protein
MEQSPSVAQLAKKLPSFYGTRKFITAFTGARLGKIHLVHAHLPYFPRILSNIIFLSTPRSSE